MIYVSAVYADEVNTLVTGTDADGRTETVPVDFTVFRCPDDGPVGFTRKKSEGGVGGTIQPWQAPPAPPLPDLAPYQFRAMLKLSGKQDQLYAVLDALPEPGRTVAQSKLEYSLTFKRDNDLVLAAQGALGLSAKELDQLWLQASLIV